jgi:hypothetical protein
MADRSRKLGIPFIAGHRAVLVTLDAAGKATGVNFIDKKSGRRRVLHHTTGP